MLELEYEDFCFLELDKFRFLGHLFSLLSSEIPEVGYESSSSSSSNSSSSSSSSSRNGSNSKRINRLRRERNGRKDIYKRYV